MTQQEPAIGLCPRLRRLLRRLYPVDVVAFASMSSLMQGLIVPESAARLAGLFDGLPDLWHDDCYTIVGYYSNRPRRS